MGLISIYYNRHASNAQHDKEQIERLKTKLFRHKVQFKAPSTVDDLRTMLREDIENKTDYVFSVGGDGTANLIIQELAGTSVKLFVIPSGTANDLATELGLNEANRRIVEIFQHKSFSPIDLIDINGRLMATNGGIGLACNVAAKVNKYRRNIPGFKSLMRYLRSNIYSLTLGKELLAEDLKFYRLKIESTDFPLPSNEVRTAMMLVNNQPVLAGKFRIAPDTNNRDGRFNITIFKHDNKMDLLKCIMRVKNGDYPHDDPHLVSFETKKIKISNLEGDKITFFGDGELLRDADEFLIQSAPQTLNCFRYDPEKTYSTSYSLQEIHAV